MAGNRRKKIYLFLLRFSWKNNSCVFAEKRVKNKKINKRNILQITRKWFSLSVKCLNCHLKEFFLLHLQSHQAKGEKESWEKRISVRIMSRRGIRKPLLPPKKNVSTLKQSITFCIMHRQVRRRLFKPPQKKHFYPEATAAIRTKTQKATSNFFLEREKKEELLSVDVITPRPSAKLLHNRVYVRPSIKLIGESNLAPRVQLPHKGMIFRQRCLGKTLMIWLNF